mmetsp:Transcript_20958/g.59799  ORF Transcript_20958/g.59799 Transcript_20958/m.59799 type:complete len:545 (+) Transcript_20958:1650-3284(+)
MMTSQQHRRCARPVRTSLQLMCCVLLVVVVAAARPIQAADRSSDEKKRSSSTTAASNKVAISDHIDIDQDSVLSQPLPRTRAERFPSIEQRIQLYMSNWYSPPCDDYDSGKIAYQYAKLQSSDEKSDHDSSSSSIKMDDWLDVVVTGMKDHPEMNASIALPLHSNIEPDMVFFIDRETTFACANISFPYYHQADSAELAKQRQEDILEHRVKFYANMKMYCYDVVDSVLTALNDVQWERHGYLDYTLQHDLSMAPIIVQFGDNPTSHVFRNVNVPHLKKFRSAVASPTALQDVVVANDGCYSSPRKPLDHVLKEEFHKFEPIIWKFATHRHFRLMNAVAPTDIAWSKKKDMAIFRGQLTGAKGNYEKGVSDYDNCQNMIRCRLVYKFAKSKLVDAKLTSLRNRLPESINGVELTSKKLVLKTLLSYKGIVMIEGNDVASGLKWALLSQSVVLMPIPRHTSWAMEELLEPWVHYIPLDDDALNLEERMQWVMDNDEAAQRIAQRGSLWMEDLVFHPDAAEEDRIIQEEILNRYFDHFVAAEAERR